MRYDECVTEIKKGAPRAPRSQGTRTTLRVPAALAAVADDLARELRISRNDALLRLATRGARLHEEDRAIAEIRAARWAAVIPGDMRVDEDAVPSAEEARAAVLAGRDLS